MKTAYFGKKVLVTFLFIFKNLMVSESKHRLENGDFGAKIVGGKSVALEKYPFAVQFLNMGALCGGVILNSWTILTSGHCLSNNHDLDEMRIQIGSNYVYDFKAKKHEVDSFVVHENYDKGIPFSNDIALVFVKEPMQLGKMSKKGILVNTNKWMNDKEKRFIVTGWGWQQYGGEVSKINLKMTYLSYVSIEKCMQLHNLTFSQDMFCLYGDGVRDSCRGDSGGGVLWKGMIVGLTSHGDGCAKKNKPSVYTNIWYLRTWIKKQVYKFINDRCTDQTTPSLIRSAPMQL